MRRAHLVFRSESMRFRMGHGSTFYEPYRVASSGRWGWNNCSTEEPWPLITINGQKWNSLICNTMTFVDKAARFSLALQPRSLPVTTLKVTRYLPLEAVFMGRMLENVRLYDSLIATSKRCLFQISARFSSESFFQNLRWQATVIVDRSRWRATEVSRSEAHDKMRIFLACGVPKIEQCKYRDLFYKHKEPPLRLIITMVMKMVFSFRRFKFAGCVISVKTTSVRTLHVLFQKNAKPWVLRQDPVNLFVGVSSFLSVTIPVSTWRQERPWCLAQTEKDVVDFNGSLRPQCLWQNITLVESCCSPEVGQGGIEDYCEDAG